MKTKNPIILVLILILGILAAWMILEIESHDSSHDHDDHDAHEISQVEDTKGPHGGWLLGDKEFQLEVKIFEDGMPPEFRLFGYTNDASITPNDYSASISVIRLGTPIEKINFKPKNEYLLGDMEVYEPHSFKLEVNAAYQGNSYHWEIEQLEGRITLSDENTSASGVDIEAASSRDIIPTLRFPGEIDFNHDRLAHIVSRLPGVATHVFKKQGDEVKKGELLAIIDSRELTRLRGDYQAAKRRLELAKATYDREARLWESKKTSEQEFLTAKQNYQEATINRDTALQQLQALGFNKKQLDSQSEQQLSFSQLEIRAPFAGTIIEKHISTGEVVATNTEVFKITDLSLLWGNITVHAQDLGNIHLNQKVLIKSTSLGKSAEGKINFVGAEINAATQSISARIEIPNKEGIWRPGLFVTVDADLMPKHVPVAVRKEAIQTFRDWNVVFARFGDQFEIRPIELGISDDEWVEVLSGLNPNQAYAAKNSYLIKADIGKSGASHDH